MDNQRKRVSDRLALVGAALGLIGLFVAASLFADKYHASHLWVFGLFTSLGFIAVIGRDFKGRFRSASFVLFFLAWLLVHVLLFAFFLVFFGLLYWALAVPVELAIGYLVARKLFNVPFPWDVDSRSN